MGRITHGPGPSIIIPKLAPEEAVSPTGEAIVYVDRVQFIEVAGPERIVYVEAPPSVEIQEREIIKYVDKIVPVEKIVMQEVVKEVPKIIVKEIKVPVETIVEKVIKVENIERILEEKKKNHILEQRLNKAFIAIGILSVLLLSLGVAYV